MVSGSIVKGRTFLVVCFAIVLAALATASFGQAKDPYPPCWSGGSGTSIHYQPVPWPAEGAWRPYQRLGRNIQDPRTQDPSNGGTRPQGYVNIASGCPDQSLPSLYTAFDATNNVFFFRWRVEAAPYNYATGPAPGTYGSTNPWNSAQWTVLFDLNGDGYRDFAMHIDGSSGAPAVPVDVLRSYYSTTLSQSLDFYSDPLIHVLAHNPSGFVDCPAGTDIILNFHNSLSPTASWPNGANEVLFDYGTTRGMDISTGGCLEYFVDYQIPLAMLNAAVYGGPTITANTPVKMAFTTANSLQDPLQKDVALNGDEGYVSCLTCPVPFGDPITPGGGTTIPQPIVTAVTASGCNPATLTTTINAPTKLVSGTVTTTITEVKFYYYYDADGNGSPDDGSTWTDTGTSPTQVSGTLNQWTASWTTTSLRKGQYLLGVKATATYGSPSASYTTWSYLTTAQTPPNYLNPSPIPGAVYTPWINTCGSSATLSKSANPSQTTVGTDVQFTLTFTNTLTSAVSVESITDQQPSGFSYKTTDGGTLGGTISSYPTVGATGNITWTFSSPVSIPAGATRTFLFTSATTGAVEGNYNNTASAYLGTTDGTITTPPCLVNLGTPRLTLSKSASVSVASPGDAVSYTITYANFSSRNVTGAVITDTIPAGLTYVSCTGGGTHSGGTVTWNIGAIAAGAGPFSLTVNVTVDNPYPSSAPGTAVNTATATSNETSPTTATSSVVINVARAELVLEKVAPSPNYVAPGANATFTIYYQNVGNADATGVVLTDPIPSGWTFSSATGGGTNVSGTVTWNLGTVTVAAGRQSVTVTLTASNPYTGSNPATNTASITGTGLGTVNSSATIGVRISACTGGPTLYFRDNTPGFTVPSPPATSRSRTAETTQGSTEVLLPVPTYASSTEFIRFYDTRTPSTSAQSFTGNITVYFWANKVGSTNPNCTIEVYGFNDTTQTFSSLLGSATSANITGGTKEYTVTITPTGTLPANNRLCFRLYATGDSWEFFYNISTRNSRAEYCTLPMALTLDKSVDKLSAVAGNTLTYTMYYSCPVGGTGVTGATITDTLPAGVTYSSCTGGTSCGNSGGVVTWTIGNIAAGGSGTVTLTVTINNPLASGITTIDNSATLSSNETPSVTATASTKVGRPQITLSKSASSSLLVPGNTVTFTIVAQNTGSAAASNVVLTDNLSSIIDTWFTVGTISDGGSYSAPSITWPTIPSIAAGASVTRTFQMTVASSGVPSGLTVKTNAAGATEATSGPYTSNTVTVTVSANPILTLSKGVSPAGPVTPGATLTYTLTLGNTGGATATSLSVVDAIPANTTFKAGSITANGGFTGSFDGANNQVVYTAASLASGATATLTFQVTVNSPLPNGSTVITNSATVTASNAASKTATVDVTANAAPVLALAKSGPSTIVYPLTTLTNGPYTNATSVTVADPQYITVNSYIYVNGTASKVTAINWGTNTLTLETAISGATGDSVFPTMLYTLTYSNTGNANASGVTITDTLPLNLAVIQINNGGTSDSGTPPTITWTIGDLKAGASGSVSVLVRPTGTFDYSNTGTIDSTETTPSNSNTVITSSGSIRLWKDNSGTLVVNNTTGGTTTSYRLYAMNTSASVTATNVLITDTLPTGFSYNGTTSAVGGTRTGTTDPTGGDTQPVWGTWSLGPGETLTITFVANVAGTVPAGTYKNNVSATASGVSITPFDPTSTTDADKQVVWPADWRVTLGAALLDSPCNIGCDVTLTITTTNVGSADGTISITQVLPSTLTFVGFGSYSVGTPSYDSGTRTITWTGIPVNMYQTATLPVNVTIASLSGISTCASLSASSPSDTNPTNNTGCAYFTPTPVVLSGFRTTRGLGGVTVEWETESEAGAAGFVLYRFSPGAGDFLPIGEGINPAAVGAPQGARYRIQDEEAPIAEELTYLLVEQTFDGQRIPYGPFSAFPDIPETAMGEEPAFDLGAGRYPYLPSENPARVLSASGFAAEPKEVSHLLLESPEDAGPSAEGIEASSAPAGATGVLRGKMTVREDGLYSLDGATVASLLGLPADQAPGLINGRNVTITCKGQPVAWAPFSKGGSVGLSFYGQSIRSMYTGDNVYWLSREKGLEMQQVSGKPSGTPPSAPRFMSTMHSEQDAYGCLYVGVPESDFWYWKYLIGGHPTLGSQSFPVSSPGALPGGTASLTVHLFSANDTTVPGDHRISVSVNGSVIGSDTWDGVTLHDATLSFDSGLLQDGVNTVTVAGLLNPGVTFSLVFVDSFDVSYPRRYRAFENALLCRADENPLIVVEGLATSDIQILDLTEPMIPKIVKDAVVSGARGNYQVVFKPASKSTPYFVATAASRPPAAVRSVPDTDLRTPSPQAEYVILTTPDLAVPAERLANLRRARGWTARVVQLEEVTNAFSHGIFTPVAIRNFLAYATANWAKPPRFLVLAGDGSYDYKNAQGLGGNLLPPVMVTTNFGMFPSDNFLADLNGDGSPEVPVGRLPVTTAAELDAVVSKIEAYEIAPPPPQRRVVLTADDPDGGGDFPASSETLVPSVPPACAVDKIYLSVLPIAEARLRLKNDWAAGTSLVSYLGHASLSQIGTPALVKAQDVPGLTGTAHLPFLVATTCYINSFHHPGGDPLGAVLVKQPGAGAIAVFSSAGMSLNFHNVTMEQDLFDALWSGQANSLGEAVQKGLMKFVQTGGDKTMAQTYTLIGDPGLLSPVGP